MKRFIILILAILLMLSLCACSGTSAPSVTDTPESTTKATEETTEAPKEEYKTVLSLENAEHILSAEQESIKIDNIVAYNVTMKVGATERTFRVTAPLDYMHKQYPCVFYFPEIRPCHEFDASIFAEKGYVCFGFLYYNVFEDDFENEMAYLGSLVEKCTFIKDGSVFATGSSSGSIRAFLLAKVLGEQVKGVCVANSICDLTAMYSINDTCKSICTAMCKGSPAEVPEAYERLSAKAFADKILCPVMLIQYKGNPNFPISICNDMKATLEGMGKECSIADLNKAGADFFTEEAENALFDFIESIDGEKEQ